MGRCDHCGGTGKGLLWTRPVCLDGTVRYWILCADCRQCSNDTLLRWTLQLEGPYELRGLEVTA